MNEKQLAGEKAAEYIKDGMTVGLGTGSTVYYTICKLGRMVEAGLNIRAVSTSARTMALAASLGIQILDLNEIADIDLTIDGADEVDEKLNGIKGGGGALLYEKIVAKCSKHNIWVVDSSKYKAKLGVFPLPVEVIPKASRHLYQLFEEKHMNPVFRKAEEEYFVTDSQNYIIDLHLTSIDYPEKLADWLKQLTGVVEHGLFLNIADEVILADGNQVNVISRRASNL